MKVAIILNTPSETPDVLETDVIYTDGAYRFQEKLNKNVVALVGDFDTLNNIPSGINIVRLEREKDFTDGEKAIFVAKEYGYTEAVVYGATDGKIEHVLGNVVLLKVAKDIGLDCKIVEKNRQIFLVDGKQRFATKKGKLISVFPYGNECSLKSSKGLYYSLNDLQLTFSNTRGISNVAVLDDVEIEVKQGYALVIVER